MRTPVTLARTLLALVSAFASAAMAQGYVGVSFGRSDFKVDCSDATSCDKTDTGYRLFGGYMFTPNLGLEGGWVDLGKAKATGVFDVNGGTAAGSAELKSRGFSLAAVGVAPFDQFSVFGKLGLANLKSKSSVRAAGISDSESKSSTNFYFGVGAGYEFTKNVGARLEWERFRIKFADDEKDNVDLLSVGLRYRF